MRRSGSLSKASKSAASIGDSWHPLGEHSELNDPANSLANLNDVATTSILNSLSNPNNSKTPYIHDPLNESHNPFYNYFISNETYSNIRETMINNETVALVLPPISKDEFSKINQHLLSEELQNYILYFESGFNDSSNFNTRFTSLSGIYGFIDPARVYIQGKFPKDSDISNLDPNKFLSTSDTSRTSLASTNPSSDIFNVLNPEGSSINFKYLLKKKVHLDNNSYLNCLFIETRILDSDIVPHYSYPQLLSIDSLNSSQYEAHNPPNLDSQDSLSRPSDNLHSNELKSPKLPPRKSSIDTSKKPSVSSASEKLSRRKSTPFSISRSNSISYSPHSKLIQLKLAYIQVVSKFRLDFMHIVGKAMHNYTIDTALESLVNSSSETIKKLKFLKKKNKYLDSNENNPNFDPSQHHENVFFNSDLLSFKKLDSVSHSWNSNFEKLLDAFHSVLSFDPSSDPNDDLDNISHKNTTVIMTIIEKLSTSIAQIAIDWIYDDALETIKLFGGNKNDELVTSQIANLSLAGVELAHLIHGSDPNINDSDSSLSQYNLSISLLKKESYLDKLESYINEKVGKRLSQVSTTRIFLEKINCIICAIEYTSTSCNSYQNFITNQSTSSDLMYSDDNIHKPTNDYKNLHFLSTIDENSNYSNSFCDKPSDEPTVENLGIKVHSKDVAHLDITDKVSDALGIYNPEIESTPENTVLKGKEISNAAISQIDSTSHNSLEHQDNSGFEKSQSLNTNFTGADLLLPIYIYAIVKCNPLSLFTNLKLIELFYPKKMISSFQSYCLTTTHAAIMYIQNVTLKELGLSSEIDSDLK
ncbi:hypothetical protein AYI70_g9993 [Smittium culicis]|uniref:VPS9 domain-containing protein n=1 Tax=Smittium culicis TaxID=133412 RepID=A0A1R1X8K9_9FUNG|nr:hypothetical protein AYI70_g9993 [Smittium culicis]